MTHRLYTKSALAAALLALGVTVGASAQTPSTGVNKGSQGTTAAGSAGAGTAGATGTGSMDKGAGTNSSRAATTPTGKGASDAKLSSGDRKFIEEAATGGMAEVELGKLAASKASSDQVKQFGQRMVDDHSKANDQLKQVASTKGVTLPTTLDSKHKREMDKLSKLSGAQFDREYMKSMVSDHKKDVSDFRKQSKSAKDADVKSFASSTLPTLEQHLQLAQQTESAAKSEGRASSKGASGGASGAGSATASGGSTTGAASGASGASKPGSTTKGGS